MNVTAKVPQTPLPMRKIPGSGFSITVKKMFLGLR